MAELFYPAVDHAHELPGRDLSVDRRTLQSVPAILPELLPVQTVSLAGGIQIGKIVPYERPHGVVIIERLFQRQQILAGGLVPLQFLGVGVGKVLRRGEQLQLCLGGFRRRTGRFGRCGRCRCRRRLRGGRGLWLRFPAAAGGQGTEQESAGEEQRKQSFHVAHSRSVMISRKIQVI